MTLTNEPFQPVRLYYSIPERASVSRRLRALKCLVEVPEERCWQWLFHAEAASLRFGSGYEDRGGRSFWGRIRFPDDSGMVLQTNSVARAVGAAKFFAPYLGPECTAIRCRLINRLFAAEEGRLEELMKSRAIVMLLEPLFEQDFMPCSYGYRPGRNAHQALQTLQHGIMKHRGYWVLEVDIRKFFDSLPRTVLRESLARRVTDGVVRRLIDKWLKAGVLESGQIHYPDSGTPQGSVISPILSNVVLHRVVDEWFTQQVRPRLRGPSTLVRFCDDFVMLFAHREDAERVQAVLGKRLGRFGLQLHPDKTRLVDFRPGGRPSAPGEPTLLPTTFDLCTYGAPPGRGTR